MEIVLPLTRCDRDARKLTVHHADSILLHAAIHEIQIIRTDLMPQPAGTTMDQHDNLAFVHAKGMCRSVIEQVFHRLDLNKVVPRTQGPQLLVTTLFCASAHLLRIGTRKTSKLLDPRQILFKSILVLHRPAGAVRQDSVNLLPSEIHRTFATRATRYITKDLVQQSFQICANIFRIGVYCKQPHTAINIKAHAARRNHTVIQICQARECGDIGYLFPRLVTFDLFQQLRIGIDHPIDLHPLLVRSGKPVAIVVDTDEHLQTPDNRRKLRIGGWKNNASNIQVHTHAPSVRELVVGHGFNVHPHRVLFKLNGLADDSCFEMCRGAYRNPEFF